MRRLALVLILGATLGLPAVATAAAPPTTEQFRWVQRVAATYWHTPPPCGRPIIGMSTLSPDRDAESEALACTLTLSNGVDWRDFPVQLCVIFVHEMGHLVLGPHYFAATNPLDPSHSLDPENIMFHSPNGAQVPRLARTVGCAATRKRSGRARP